MESGSEIKPNFVKVQSHKLPNGKTLKESAAPNTLTGVGSLLSSVCPKGHALELGCVASKLKSDRPNMSIGTAVKTCGCAQETSWPPICMTLSRCGMYNGDKKFCFCAASFLSSTWALSTIECHAYRQTPASGHIVSWNVRIDLHCQLYPCNQKKTFHAIHWNTPYLLKDLHLKENKKNNQKGRLWALGG